MKKTPSRKAPRRPRGLQQAPTVSLGADETWVLTEVEPEKKHFRRHVDILAGPGSSEPVARLPVTIYAGTRYVAEITTPETDHADPEDPLRPSRGTERRLTLGVTTREDYKRRAKQRDKVQLAFNDFTRKRNLLVDIESPEERFVAFDIMFDPTYELAPNTHYVLHFQGLQVGMVKAVLEDSGQPPFSIRVQGTTPDQPDPMAPIELRFERRWFNGRGEVEEEVLADRIPPHERGRWYRFVLRLLPGYDRGAITCWHWDLETAYDRCDAPLNDWSVPWGYKPVASGDPKVDFKRRTIQYAVGIYRRSSESTQRLHLRNIRFGTTYDEVNPGPPC